MKKWVKRAFAGVVATACLSFGMAARANSIELFLSSHTVDGSGNTVYTYEVDLTAGNQVRSGAGTTGDFFVLYDISGLVSESETLTTAGPPAQTWATVVENSTVPQPTSQTVADNPTIPNIEFRYTSGATIDNPDLGSHTSKVLGTVTVVSSIPFSSTSILTYSGQDHVDATGAAGGNTDTVNGPTVAPLPSTASMGLTMIAACGIAGMAMKLRRKEVVA